MKGDGIHHLMITYTYTYRVHYDMSCKYRWIVIEFPRYTLMG